MSGDRDQRGRFRPGNQARRRRQRVLSTHDLVQLVDRQLAAQDDERQLDEVVAGLVVDLIRAAIDGDRDAARWLIDRFCPPDRQPRAKLGRLPKPSEEPLKFLDAIAAAVGAGKLPVDAAEKLSRLATTTVADKQLADALAQLRRLEERLHELEKDGKLRIAG